MSITFKDLENFIACANSKTLSEAAERLEMAQPSLSLGIKKLEAELGQTLFLRSRDGITLSPNGKMLLPEAKEILNSLERFQGNKKIQKFKIGCHPSVGMFILGPFLKIMHKKRPDISFEIVNSSSHDTNKLVASGTIDFGLVMNPIKFQGLIEKEIGEDEFAVWNSPNRYQDKLIYNPALMQTLSILSRWKKAPRDIIEVDNLELIAKLVDQGAGLGILPNQVVRSQKMNLQKLEQLPTFKDQLALVCYPEMIKTAEGRIVFEALKQSFQSH